MSGIIKFCPGCSRPMIEKSGVFMCRSEDGVQERETRPVPSSRYLIDGTNIIDFTKELPGGRVKGAGDYAHDAYYNARFPKGEDLPEAVA